MQGSNKSKLKNFIILIIMTLVTVGSFSVFLTLVIDEPDLRVAYAASDNNKVTVYSIQNETLSESFEIPRGTMLSIYETEEQIEGKSFVKLAENPKQDDEYDNLDLYVESDKLTADKKDIVREREVYVRTASTIYKEASGPAIESFAAKGSILKVEGYDNLNEDGSVNKYKVSIKDDDNKASGYVYSRYVVKTKEEAGEVYNANGIFDKVKNDNYGINLYGGKAANLDYYPAYKPKIDGNEFCDDAKAMYINGQAAVNPQNYVKIIKGSACNAVVIDIKDGYLAYTSDVAKEYSPKSYKSAYSDAETYKKGVDEYRKTGAYLIGRIVVFNDSLYAKDHPEDCIKYGKDKSWPSAYSRNVWEYNVRLAIEAAKEFGFNEIQFDYVRFPEAAYEMSKSGKADFKNTYSEEKGQAIQNFCIYAADMLHEEGIYMSVDVFGESAYGYMTAYGQYWPGISNVADAISAMPYTDHMGSDGAWDNPYKTMLAWSKKAKKQQDKLENPAAARTWITGYNTPHWNPVVDYDDKKLADQVKALNKAGLSGGFIPWNAASDISKYREYKKVWS